MQKFPCKILGVFRNIAEDWKRLKERTRCDSRAFQERSGLAAKLALRHNNVCGKSQQLPCSLTLCLAPGTGAYAKVLTLITTAGISRLANPPKIPRRRKALAARFRVKAKLARLLIDVLIDNDDDGTNNDNFPSIYSIMAALMRFSLFAQTCASEMYLLLLLHFAHENCPIANVRLDLKSASKQMNNLFQRVSVTFVFVCCSFAHNPDPDFRAKLVLARANLSNNCQSRFLRFAAIQTREMQALPRNVIISEIFLYATWFIRWSVSGVAGYIHTCIFTQRS